MGLADAIRGVAYAIQSAHGGTAAITLTRVGGTATPTDATVYRERTEWRRTKDDREQVIVRKVVLRPDASAVPIGSVFVVDGLTYTVEHVSKNHIGSQSLRGTRTAAASVSRDGYYGRFDRRH